MKKLIIACLGVFVAGFVGIITYQNLTAEAQTTPAPTLINVISPSKARIMEGTVQAVIWKDPSNIETTPNADLKLYIANLRNAYTPLTFVGCSTTYDNRACSIELSPSVISQYIEEIKRTSPNRSIEEIRRGFYIQVEAHRDRGSSGSTILARGKSKTFEVFPYSATIPILDTVNNNLNRGSTLDIRGQNFRNQMLVSLYSLNCTNVDGDGKNCSETLISSKTVSATNNNTKLSVPINQFFSSFNPIRVNEFLIMRVSRLDSGASADSYVFITEDIVADKVVFQNKGTIERVFVDSEEKVRVRFKAKVKAEANSSAKLPSTGAFNLILDPIIEEGKPAGGGGPRTVTYSSPTLNPVNGIYTIPRGTSAEFNINAEFGTLQMFAGAYKAHIYGVYFADGNNNFGWKNLNVHPSVQNNTTAGQVVIVGERSPYISEVSTQNTNGYTSQITLRGVRFDQTMPLYVDGVDRYTATTSNGVSIIPVNALGLSPGLYRVGLSLESLRTGKSNIVYVDVNIPESRKPSVDIINEATLLLVYDRNNRESSLVGTFRGRISGGSQNVLIPVNSFESTLYNGEKYYNHIKDTQLASSFPGLEVRYSPNDGRAYYLLPANVGVNFTLTKTLNPQYLYAGAYTESLVGISVQDSNYLDVGVDIPTNTTNRVTVVGENATTNSPSITITSPNGGENWELGREYRVSYRYSNIGGNQGKINLIKQDRNGGCLLKYVGFDINPAEVNSTEVDLSQGCLNRSEFGEITAGNYKVNIFVGNVLIQDYSDNFFTISSGSPSTTPQISSLSRTSGTAGNSVTITGTGFNSSTRVYFNGSSRSTTYVNSTTLRFSVPSTSAGAKQVNVKNGSLVSNSQTFTVTSDPSSSTYSSPSFYSSPSSYYSPSTSGSGTSFNYQEEINSLKAQIGALIEAYNQLLNKFR